MKTCPVKNSFRVKIMIIILLCLQLPLYSQTTTYIDGKVIDSNNRKPVPFATIKLKTKQLGVYANANGDFKIINNPEFLNDSLIISCIGFRRHSVAFKDLNPDKINQIILSPSVYGLAEVKIEAKKVKLNSVTIVSRAITNIRKNYPVKPFSYIAYYRDYQKRDDNYINLNEAIIQTLDGGFNTKSVSNQYHLLDFRKNNDFPRLNVSPYYENYTGPELNIDYKNIPGAVLGDQYGNELFILMVHDALRNYNARSFSFIDTFNQDFLFNHSFSDPVAIYNNNLLLYRIPFSGRSNATGSFLQVSGAIYIQPKDYTIHKLEYSCSYDEKGKEPKPMFKVDIEYGYENSVDSLMCLKYISFNNIFNVIEIDDNKYLKIRDSYWSDSDSKVPVITIAFNRFIDTVSAVRKENYEINMGRKEAKIISVKVKDKNKVMVELVDDNFDKLRDSCVVEAKNIKDIDGNIIGRRKTVELYQFRELFVQEYNKLPLSDSCFIRYLPLEQNCISKYTGVYNYWMNTPEKPAQESTIKK
jgi:hypothetical protein